VPWVNLVPLQAAHSSWKALPTSVFSTAFELRGADLAFFSCAEREKKFLIFVGKICFDKKFIKV
jgi:hypothetical protein